MQFRSLKGTGEPRVASCLSCKHFQDRVPCWTKQQQQKQSTREVIFVSVLYNYIMGNNQSRARSTDYLKHIYTMAEKRYRNK